LGKAYSNFFLTLTLRPTRLLRALVCLPVCVLWRAKKPLLRARFA